MPRMGNVLHTDVGSPSFQRVMTIAGMALTALALGVVIARWSLAPISGDTKMFFLVALVGGFLYFYALYRDTVTHHAS